MPGWVAVIYQSLALGTTLVVLSSGPLLLPDKWFTSALHHADLWLDGVALRTGILAPLSCIHPP